MAFTPTQNVLDTSPIEGNILAFIAENQADALLLANGSPLKPFNFIDANLANKDAPGFPILEVKGSKEAIPLTSDIVETVYQINFECGVAGKSAAELPAKTKKYAYALKLLLANIPADTLAAGIEAYTIARAEGLEDDYGELLTNDAETIFYQIFRITALYRLSASSYN